MYAVMPLPVNVLAASLLHAIEAAPFLGTQVAVGSHAPFRTPDTPLPEAIFRAVLTPVDPPT